MIKSRRSHDRARGRNSPRLVPVCYGQVLRKALGQALRHGHTRHWHIENRLRRVMDVIFHNDLMRLRTDNESANRAAVNT